MTQSTRRLPRRLTTYAAASAVFAATAAVYAAPTHSAVAAPATAVSAAAGADAVAGTAERILDTREQDAAHSRLSGGTEISVSIPDASPGQVLAVNATAVNPAGKGWLAVYTGVYAGTSTLNYSAAESTAGASYLIVGADRTVKVRSLVDTDVVLDIVTSFGGDVITPVPAFRAVDTRKNATSVPHFTADAPLAVPVAGRGGVPAGARAAIVNITATEAATDGWVETNPTPGKQGATSAVNYRAGRTVANNAIVPLDGEGKLTLGSLNAVHLVVDVTGYVADASSLELISGTRVLDTRESVPTWATDERVTDSESMYAGGANRRVRFSGTDIAAQLGLPTAAVEAVAVNITVVDPVGPGFAEVWEGPHRERLTGGELSEHWSAGNTSFANYTSGQNVANGGLIAVSELATLDIFTQADSELVVDIVGYVPARPRTISKTFVRDSTSLDAMAPVVRTAEPLRVAPGSTVTFAAPDGKPLSSRMHYAQTTKWAGCERPRTPQLRSTNPFDGAEEPLFDATNGSGGAPAEFENAIVLNVGPKQGIVRCGVRVFAADEPVAPRAEDHVLLVDLDISADAERRDVAFADLQTVTEQGLAHFGLGSFGPGDTLRVAGAPAGTYGPQTEIVVTASSADAMGAAPAVTNDFMQAWTVSAPLAGDQLAAAASADGTSLAITLPDDPSVYSEFLAGNGFEPKVFVRSGDDAPGGATYSLFDAFEALP